MKKDSTDPPAPSSTLGKRRIIRARKRVMVRYGVAAADRTAFTKNVSESGLFLQTNMILKPGTTMQVQMRFPDRTFNFWARVVWAKQVPPALAHVLDCGMGIRFVDPGPEWLEYYKSWSKP